MGSVRSLIVPPINVCLLGTCRYLSEFLYAWLMSTLSRADSSQMAEERIMEEQLKGRSSKKTKKKKKGILSGSGLVSKHQLHCSSS